MPSQQIIAAEIPADSSTLLGRFGEYEIYPLQACSEDKIADLFSKVCQRTNPLLKGRPHEDLILLGRAIYRKCLPLGMSQVAMLKGEPVALNANWDAAEGGAWKDSGLTMPASLGAHAEVAVASFGRLNPDEKNSRVFCCAFNGVNPPHTGKLFGVMGLTGLYVAHASGFKKSFQYSVLANILGRTQGNSHLAENEFQRHIEPVPFASIATSNEVVRTELKEMNGESRGSVTHLSWMTSKGYIPAIAAAVRATPEELTGAARECADRHLEILKGRNASAPSSRL